MDRAHRYRAIIRCLVEEYARWKPSHGQIENELIIDPVGDHYVVMHVGWHDQRRVHGPVIHIDLIDDKIWVQHDATNRPIADELVAAGVPREHIVLGFHPANVRKYTDYALD